MNVFHGPIITCDQENSLFNYLVEDKGKIIYLGNELPDLGDIVEIFE